MSADLVARARAWLDDDDDPVTRTELAQLIDAGATAELAERFAGPLAFGTAGLRALLGAGESRMNLQVIRRTTAGLATYLLAHVPGAAQAGVVVGHDARRRSREFAEVTARVLVGAGFTVHLAPRAWPTPTTAWAVTRFAAAAGVMVTASHNPPAYNGFKVYAATGGQIIAPVDEAIAAAIAQVGSSRAIACPTHDEARASGRLRELTEADHDAYLAAVRARRQTGAAHDHGLVFAYTPLHGVGAASVERVFADAGLGTLHSEASQRDPDGEFPTVAFPNPEEPGALDRVLALGTSVRADVVLANDPDADRLCAAVRVADGFQVLTGDQLGVLLADYLLTVTPANAPRLVATTIVSSQLLRDLAAAHGADYRETLTGFKWIADAALRWEAVTGGSFVMGYEEAIGYTVGDLVRDKDGVAAAVAVADLAAWNRARGRTIADHLADLYRRIGLFLTTQVSWTLTGTDGLARMAAVMAGCRATPPQALAGVAVVATDDLGRPGGPLPPSDVLIHRLADGGRVIVRPSGTEPKLKAYYEVRVAIGPGEDEAEARRRGQTALAALRDAHQARLRDPALARG